MQVQKTGPECQRTKKWLQHMKDKETKRRSWLTDLNKLTESDTGELNSTWRQTPPTSRVPAGRGRPTHLHHHHHAGDLNDSGRPLTSNQTEELKSFNSFLWYQQTTVIIWHTCLIISWRLRLFFFRFYPFCLLVCLIYVLFTFYLCSRE